MSNPLSPLSSSNHNARIRSPVHTTPTIGRVVDMDTGKENVSPLRWDSPSPKKEERKEEPQTVPETTTAQETSIDGMDDGDSSVLAPGPPSSPFQTEVFSGMSEGLEKENSSPAAEGTELSKKRSHEEICVDEEDEDEDELRPNQGLTIAVDKMMEEHERKQRCVESEANDAPQVDEESDNRLEENCGQEFGNNTINEKLNEGMSTVVHEEDDGDDAHIAEGENEHQGEEGNSMEDTCLSNFSAIPNADMTAFSKLKRVSPAKRMREERWSPSKQARDAQYNADVALTPSTVRRDGRRSHIPELDDDTSFSPTGSPTPRKGDAGRANDTTNLLDFTDQFNAFAQASQAYKTHNGRISTSPSRRAPRASPSKGADSLRTPAKFNLLDFDIPPAPTPRSIPTITPRELESLKSSFLSEISSLKATLSGKEAEVTSLKEAVSDAERRVGEALEEVRNESARKEALEQEQGEWERRSKDLETVLDEIKAEVLGREREIATLNKRAEDAEKSKEHLEGRVVELQSQLSAARKVAATPSKSVSKSADSTGEKNSEDTAREVQDAVEKVARELHTLYKGKHETKVAALKKSYEARWEKRVKETETKLQKAVEENERLKTEHDATMPGVVPAPIINKDEEAGNANASFIARDPEEIEAEKRVIEARLKGMEQEMAAVRQESEILRAELKSERTEKGELVAVVDEWMSMQQQQQQHEQQQMPTVTPEPPTPQASQPVDKGTAKKEPVESAKPTTETLTRSIARPGTSGMRPPSAMGTSGIGAGERRIGRFGMPSGHTRGNSGGAGRAAPLGGGAGAGRSGIMSSIERMGRGGAGAGA